MLTGPAVRPPLDEERTHINVHPEVVARLRRLLFHPNMRAVGYTEFIERACIAAEAELDES